MGREGMSDIVKMQIMHFCRLVNGEIEDSH